MLFSRAFNFFALIVTASTVVAEFDETLLSDPIELGNQGNVELQQYLDVEENSFTIKVTYTGGQAFIGIGLQDDGTDHMDPANAVIGQADSGVVQYRLTDDSIAGVNVADNQTLIESSFVQTDNSSTLMFTQSLDDITDRDLTTPSVWIWAIGYEGNYFTGHAQMGSVTFALTSNHTTGDGGFYDDDFFDDDFFKNNDDDDDDDSVDDDDDPLQSDCFSDPIPLGSQGNVELQQYVNFAENKFTIKVTYTGGQAFIGVGLNDEGTDHMAPANAVIGRAGAFGVFQYRMTSESAAGVTLASQQTLTGFSFRQSNDYTIMSFTQKLDDITDRDLTESNVWIWAVGYDGNAFTGHSQMGSVELALTACAAPTSAPTPSSGSSSFNNGLLASIFSACLLAVSWCAL